MSAKKKDPRRIELGGREMELRFSVNSLCEVEARAGMPIDCLLDRQFSATRLLLWAGLRERHPELSLSDVGELIGQYLRAGGTLDELVDVCAEGMREAGLLR